MKSIVYQCWVGPMRSGTLASKANMEAYCARIGAEYRFDHNPHIASKHCDVPIYYDPMISKLITWAEDRPGALARMRRALSEYQVRGIRTTIPFFRWILEDEDFQAARFDTSFLDRKMGDRHGHPLVPVDEDHAVLGAIAVAVRQLTTAAVSATASAGAPSRWQQTARLGALR